MIKTARAFVLWVAVGIILGLSGAVRAEVGLAESVSSISIFPSSGGHKTVFTISDPEGGFKKNPGSVRIGERKCRVNSWSEHAIVAEITADLESGFYDVAVYPRGSLPIILEQAFEVVAPYLITSGAVNIVPGQIFDIHGINLPKKKGKVFLAPNSGDSLKDAELLPCRVLKWSPRRVRIKVPSCNAGLYNVLLRTREGDLLSEGFFNVDTDGIDWDYRQKGSFRTTGTGVMFGGKVCRFFPGYDDSAGIFFDFSDHPAGYGNTGYIVDKDGKDPRTNNVIFPVVLGDRLYVFWTTTDGAEFEYTWTEDVTVPKPVWASLKRIKPSISPNGSRPNVLYRPQDKTLYIYYRQDGGQIVYITSKDQGITWSSAQYMVMEETNGPMTATSNDPSIVMNSNGLVMLARQVGNDVHVTVSKDPTKSSRNSTVVMGDNKGAPWLRSLGQGYVALLWQDRDDYLHIAIYADDLGRWIDNYRTSTKTFRGPTAMPCYSAYKNDPAKGQGLSLDLWYFWFDSENVYARQERYLGELRFAGEDERNWLNVSEYMALEGDEAEAARNELIKACPLVGVVDAPVPCALNGKAKEENNSSFTFTHSHATTDEMSLSWKAGIFFTSGENCYLNLDIHAGVQGAYSTRYEKTTTTIYTYKPNYDAGMVSAIHSVPVTLAKRFETYRDNKKIPSVPPIIVLEVINSSLIQIPVAPSSDNRMPRHTVGQLASYNPPVGGYAKESAGASWMGNTPATAIFSKSAFSSSMLGLYATAKVGGRIPNIVTGGVEGEFSIGWSSSTTVSDNWAFTMDNPPATQTGHVTDYIGSLLLLHGSKDPYWVPDYVTEGRDAAWFLTFGISHLNYK